MDFIIFLIVIFGGGAIIANKLYKAEQARASKRRDERVIRDLELKAQWERDQLNQNR